jgi:uncharacterized protein YfaS (alpha-2-macroglobulin family)
VVFGGAGAEKPWWEDRGLVPAAAHWEQDPVETTAIALRALLKAKPDSELIDGAVRYLLEQDLDGHWKSTKDTALVVYALADALPRYAATGAGTRVTATLDGKPLGDKTLSKDDLWAPELLVGEATNLPAGKKSVSVTRSGPGGQLAIWARLSYLDGGEGLRASGVGGFTVERHYLRVSTDEASGKETTSELGHDGEGRLIAEQDDKILVLLKVKAPEALEYAMIEDPLCSGCEVEEDDVGRKPDGRELHPAGQHREVRDERVVLFARRLQKGSTDFAYLVSPGLAGQLHVLPTTASLMYQPQVRATSDEAVLKVGGEP